MFTRDFAFCKVLFFVFQNCFAVFSRFAVYSRFGAVVSVCVQTVFWAINKKRRCVLALCCKVSLSKQFFFGRGGRICTIAKINTIDFHLFDKYNSNIKRCSFYR